jgi:thymidylate synthase (FAD)
MLGEKIKDFDKRMQVFNTLLDAWYSASRSYMKLIELGAPPDVAREVLPIGTKAEIVIQADIREWRHILKLRTSKKAHPRMRELMVPLLAELRQKIPVLFDKL